MTTEISEWMQENVRTNFQETNYYFPSKIFQSHSDNIGKTLEWTLSSLGQYYADNYLPLLDAATAIIVEADCLSPIHAFLKPLDIIIAGWREYFSGHAKGGPFINSNLVHDHPESSSALNGKIFTGRWKNPRNVNLCNQFARNQSEFS